MRTMVVWVMAVVIAVSGCSETGSEPEFEDLEPYDNPLEVDDDRRQPRPERFKPRVMELSSETGRLFVALPGTVDRPSNQVAVVDVERRTVTDRYRVGRAPSALALHPGGRHLVVAHRFSNYLSIVDLETGESRRHPVDFYTEELLFDDAGDRLYTANRWRDSVQGLRSEIDGGRLRFSEMEDRFGGRGVSVGENPERMVLSPREDELYVASPGALTVTAIDIDGGESRQLLTTASPVEVDDDDSEASGRPGTDPIPAGTARTWIGAPPFDLVVADEFLAVATLSESTHHPPGVGDEESIYSPPEKGAPNEGFRDLQNEIAILRRDRLREVERYTSASSCCPDVRDVSPEDPERGHLVPDASHRIVEGALPTAVATFEQKGDRRLLVAYGGSSEVQRFDIDGAALAPGPVVSVGFDPRELVIDAGRKEAFVANRLGESISVIDLETFDVAAEIDVGAGEAPPFPATDAEIGELVFYSGAPFSVDGDQTCNHCHFDRGNIGKFFHMPQLEDPRGSRMTMDTRGLYDTRPWYLEGAVDEEHPVLELSAMARVDNFCCEDYPSPEECVDDPPPRCSQSPYSKRPATRDRFFEETARDLIDRRESFGQAVDVSLDFQGVARLLGLFLIREPALLPNPNPEDSEAVERGRLLFESPKTGCSVCHPAPSFGVSTDVNPFGTPLLFGPVVEPARGPEGDNLDRLSEDFRRRFPRATQISDDVHFKSTSLRGLWDRVPGFYHHGRARTLREALSTPGHPALGAEQRGYNVADGVFDTHGATSHLSEDQLDDLIEFLLTL